MILRNATIQYKGYDPLTLSKGSEKRVCCICDQCGRVRYRTYNNYNRTGDLCKSCSSKVLNNGMFGKHHSDETLKLQSDVKIGVKRKPFTKDHCKNLSKTHADVSGENNPMFGVKGKDAPCYGRTGDKHPMYGLFGDKNPTWRGGCNRDHVLPKNQCIKLNTYFKGSHFHHIMSGVGVYIAKDIHIFISHNMKSGQNMNKINDLALDYLLYNF